MTTTITQPEPVYDEWSENDLAEAAWVLGSVITDIRHHNIADTAIEFGCYGTTAEQVDVLRKLAMRLLTTATSVLNWCDKIDSDAEDRGRLRTFTDEQLAVRYRHSTPAPPFAQLRQDLDPLAIHPQQANYDRVLVEVERRGLDPEQLEDDPDA